MTAERVRLDELAAATVTVAWVIVANKPFYPLYIWWLVGSGVQASLGTLIAMPLFFVLPFLARRYPLGVRVGLPLIGMLDTLLATKLFGQSSGAALFFAPCIMLVALSFRASEKWWQRGLSAFLFVVFALNYDTPGAPLHIWPDAEIATLFSINAFAVASLMAFIAIRYAGSERS